MKKIILMMTVAILATEGLYAQIQPQDWYNTSVEKTGIYGAEVDKAYEFLAQKKSKKNPIVAVIGAGVDVEHEALVKNIWTNPKEKADGIDNDGNGLVDDLHGWNFIGQKDGNVMASVGTVGDREWFRLKEKYADLLFDGKSFFKYVDGKRQEVTIPIDRAEYQYFRDLTKTSTLASIYAGWVLSHHTAALAKDMFDGLRAKYPEKTRFETDDLKTLFDIKERAERDSLFGLSFTMLHMHAQMVKNASKDPSFDYMAYIEESNVGGGQSRHCYDNFEKELAKYPVGVRETMVGDKGEDMKNKAYGNNVLLTANAAGGTMISTIIAGARGVEGRNNPICPNAQIMPLVVVNQAGEPYLKDVALAMRYAVDHGADVICFSMPNSFYPSAQRVWVEEAIRYAETKGVLIVVNSYDMSINMDETVYYPNRFMTSGKEFTNVMTVSPSDDKGNPLLKSNFGAKSVDLYAPGVAILGGGMGDVYQVGSGSILSMAVTAGVAALVKSYYPNLTGSQIRKILNESVTSRAGVEVEKMVAKRDMIQDMYLFEELCLSKGILNAYKAVQAADKMK